MTLQDLNNAPQTNTKKEWQQPEVVIISNNIESGAASNGAEDVNYFPIHS